MTTPAPDWADPALTYRKLDYWVRRGWLHPTGGAGSGYQRTWPAEERRVANLMAQITAVGIPPQVAHDAARSTGGVLQIATGVTLTASTTPQEHPCQCGSSGSTPASPTPESPDPTDRPDEPA